MQVGDTFEIQSSISPRLMKVNRVDYKIGSDGVSRKYIYFKCQGSNQEQHEWIEGIGSTSAAYCITDADQYPACYLYNDSLVVGSDLKSCWLVDTEDQFKNTIELYPNPTSSFIDFKGLDELVIDKIEIYDQMGRKVDYNFFLKDNMIDVSQLANGLYNLQFINKNKNSWTKAFIKM